MSLTPALSATFGNLRYDTQAVACSACLDLLPRGSSFRLLLPAGVRFEAVAGDDAELTLDGGEGAATVLRGTVRHVRRTVDGIEVEAADAGAALAAYRPSASFDKPTAAQVIRKLAADSAVDIGRIEVDLDLPAYIAHPGRQAAEHVAALALLGGAYACTGDDGRLQVLPLPEGPADSALRYGRELLHYEVAVENPPSPQRWAIGAGPAGSASAPDALRPTPDALPASAAAGGPGVWRQPTPLLRTARAADTASQALSSAASATRLVAEGFLMPALRPGQVIEVQDLPDGLSGGPWFLTRVEHELHQGQGRTRLEARSAAPPTGLGGLLGAAAAAIGGLL